MKGAIASVEIFVAEGGSTEGQRRRLTLTVTAGAGAVSEGLAWLVVEYTDLAGNEGTDVLAPTDTSSVLLDFTAPSLTSLRLAEEKARSARSNVSALLPLHFLDRAGVRAAGRRFPLHSRVSKFSYRIRAAPFNRFCILCCLCCCFSSVAAFCMTNLT